MDTPTFSLTTTDGTTYVQGETTTVFKDLGHDSARLESYGETGDYLVLTFAGGLQLSIPEHHIRHLAEAPA